MKNIALSVLIAAIVSASGLAHADPQLAAKKLCMSCHAIDKKLVGPAYQDVAAKYAKQKDAQAMLVERVMKGTGSKLNWGTIPMPANAQVSKAEAETLVKWVLSQKKK
jgi:cytochrome c